MSHRLIPPAIAGLVTAIFLSAAPDPAQAGPTDCAPVEEIGSLAARPEKYLLFGETHGTAEAPALFGEIVCHLATGGRPLVVGLELFETEQARFDTYFAGPDTEETRAALTSAEDWTFENGSNSVAMLNLIQRLHAMKQAGMPLTVVAISSIFEQWQVQDTGNQTFHAGAGFLRLVQAGMARAGKDARVVTLTGNVHNMRATPDYPPEYSRSFATQLPREEMLAFNLTHAGGEAHNCMATCGVNPVKPQLWGAAEDAERHVTIFKIPEGTAVPYDGRWYIGKATASPPVRRKE